MTPVAILLVEDDEVLLSILKTSLEHFFCTVSTALDAEQASQQLDKKKFDLVLTDLQLGTTSGLDVVKKAKTILPQAVILMMSGCKDPERVQAAYQRGADGYLVKPFSISSLVKRLRQQGLRLRLPGQPSVVTRAPKTTNFCQENLHTGKDFLYT